MTEPAVGAIGVASGSQCGTEHRTLMENPKKKARNTHTAARVEPVLLELDDVEGCWPVPVVEAEVECEDASSITTLPTRV